MRRASRSARQPRRALAGVALAALLAWAPFGMAAQTSAYADDSEAQEAPAVEEVIAFDEVSPDEGSFDADESAGANNEDDQLASNDVTLITDDTALATGANEHLVSNDEALVTGDGIVAYSSDALPASEDDALLPDVSTTDALISIGDAAACLDEGESEDTDIVTLASSSATYDGILAIRANKSYTLAYQVLTLVNQERAKQGLSSLTMDADLLSAAMQRGAEIAVYFSHTRPTGESYYTACSKMRGENIASGYRTAEAVVQAWMNSTGHRANILSANSKSIGISCVQVGNRYYWVQCFGTTAATTTSKPADVSNALMKVSYAKDELAEVTLSIVPVTSDGTRIDGDGSLLVGSSQRYALYMGSTPIDNSCVTWSLSSTVAKLNTSTAAVTATGVGSFTITASVGGGTVKQTRTCTTAMPVYTVSFYSNGGSNVISQSVTSGQKATKPADPTKTGYNFTGWYSDQALTKAYSFNAAVTSNMTLYAGWERITYTVSFNSNGGSAVANQTVTWGARATKPANPTKAGYTFTGWYSDSALTKEYDFNYTLVKSNLNLYAGWKQITYNVYFVTNGGSATATQRVAWGSKATKPADPTKAGYTFTGWYSDSALTKAYNFDTAVKSYLSIYAGWKQITCTVDFNANGGSAVASQTVTWGYRATKPADPTKAGYTFTGWYSDSALTQAYNFSNTLVKSNVTLYAGWKQVTYTVSFNSNGASNVASQTVTWGAAATKPADPAKSEFAFTGWYSDKALTKAYDFKTPVKSNMTLYAGWKQVIFTVSFNSQGGSAVANQKVALGSAATRPADPTKKGFTFTGWYTDTSFKTLYDFGKTVSFNMLLQAGWKQNTCTVTFETNGGSSVASQTVVGGGKATKPATPTKAGYMFVGWYCNRALTVAYDFGTTVQSDLTLYASWKQVAYTVSFVTNGGSAVAAQTVAWGGKAARPADPTKAGYIFTGWYADKALSSSYDFQTAVKSSRILYAGWRADPSALSYKDVPAGEWYTYWVAEATDAGLMTGMKDAAGNYTGYFEPNRAITRAEVATVLWRIAGSPSAGSSSMSDMRGHWAETAVAWCNAKGIVTGYTNGPDAGRFLPDKQVSRQELACMVWRFAKWAGVDTANPSTTAFNYCADAQLVPDWSRDAMIWCASASIITGIQGNGRPTLSPEVGATRAMAAKIFVRTQSRCARAAGSHSDDTAVDEAVQEALDQVTFEDVQTPQVTHGQTDEGLAYALVPEGATDKQGNAYVPGQAYAELGGRYVGAGAYVTGYTGESTELVLPAQIEGADVVSASLSWKGDAEAGQPDPDGRTRLEGLALQRGCMLASLDASGSLLAGLALAGDESLGGLEHLHFLDLSSTQVASLDTAALPALEELALRDCPLTADALAKLASWRSATNLAADLTDAGEKAEQAGGAVGATDGPTDSSADQAVAPDGTTEGDTTFDAVETGEPNQSGNAAETPSDDLNQAGDAGDVAAPVEPTDADEPDIAGEPGTSADAEGSADSPEPTPLDAPDALAA